MTLTTTLRSEPDPTRAPHRRTALDPARRGLADLRSLLAVRAETGVGDCHVYDRSTDGFATIAQRELLKRAFAAGAQLLDAGVEPGQIVLVANPAPEAALVAFLGSISVGATPAIVAVRPAFDGPKAVRARIDRLRAELPDVGATIVATGTDPAVADGISGRVLALDPLVTAEPATVTAADPDSIAYVQLTSGTTSRSRPVVITHRAVTANLAALVERCAMGPDETLLSWLPLYHDMGLVGFPLLGLATDADVALMTPFDFLTDPARWLRGLSTTGATTTVSPTFGLAYTARKADPAKLEGIDLSRLERLYCAAEPVDAETLRHFQKLYRSHGLRPEALKAGYGMAEAGLMVTMPHLHQRSQVISMDLSALSDLDRVEIRSTRALLQPRSLGATPALDLVSLGPPADGIELWLVRADGTRIESEDTCGEVTIRGECVAPGYLRPDGELDPIDPDGFRTGDIGLLHDGELYVIERRKNIIIRNGQNYAARVLEDTLCRLAGVRGDQALVIDSDIRSGKGEVTALVELDRGQRSEPITAAVLGGLDLFDPALDRLVIVRPGGLPRTTSGKKQPSEVRSRLASDGLRIVDEVRLHDLPTADPDPDPEVIDLVRIEAPATVQGLVEEHARRRGVDRPISGSLRLEADLGIDSLALFELAIAIEAAVGIEILEEHLAPVRTVDDLVNMVVAARGAPPVANRLGITRTLEMATVAVPQVLNTVRAQRGRQVMVGNRWVTDFASCNYLGLDLHPDVIDSIPPALARWGVHPSWTRAVASPEPYRELELRLARLVGAHDVVVFPTVSLLHFGVLPRLAEKGTIVLDEAAHHSIQQAADLARARGTRVLRARHDDVDHVDHQLASGSGPKVVAVDGVYSMTGGPAPLPALVEVAERHDATVYVDDAHGFGVIGESPGPEQPYGRRGNGLVRHHGLDYDRVVYVAGMSKAYSSMAAFVTVRSPEERRVMESTSTMVFSGPIPVASLASALAGLGVNAREGDELRSRLRALTDRLIEGARELGFTLDNQGGFPIVNAVVGDIEAVHASCELLWEAGMLVTPAVFPAAPLHRGGVRFTPTAANTAEEIERAIAALAIVSDAVDVRAAVS